MTNSERFNALKRIIFAEIQKRIENGCEHFSNEGGMEIIVSFPDFTRQNEKPKYIIRLYCSLFPKSITNWSAPSLSMAIDKCEEDIKRWIENGSDKL